MCWPEIAFFFRGSKKLDDRDHFWQFLIIFLIIFFIFFCIFKKQLKKHSFFDRRKRVYPILDLLYQPSFYPCADPLNRVKHIVYTGVYRGSVETFFSIFNFYPKNFSKNMSALQPDLKNFRWNNVEHFFFSEKKVGFSLFFSICNVLFFSVFLPDFPKTSIFC